MWMVAPLPSAKSGRSGVAETSPDACSWALLPSSSVQLEVQVERPPSRECRLLVEPGSGGVGGVGGLGGVGGSGGSGGVGAIARALARARGRGAAAGAREGTPGRTGREDARAGDEGCAIATAGCG